MVTECLQIYSSFSSIDSEIKEQVLALDRNFIKCPWSQDQWETSEENYLFYLFLDSNGLGNTKKSVCINEIKGFSLIYFHPKIENADLLKIIVPGKYQRQKLGSQMLTSIFSDLRSRRATTITLEVEATNLKAISFYEFHNFTKVRNISAYYSNGGSAWVMTKQL